MRPIDKKLEKDIEEGNLPKPIEDLPSEWEKEDREIEGAKPDLGELEEGLPLETRNQGKGIWR